MRRTAEHSHLEESQVLKLLTSLVDKGEHKTVQKSTADLAKSIIDDRKSSADHINLVKSALHDLEDKEFILRCSNPKNDQDMWVLDHDYLCRSVMEAERRADRWSALAQECLTHTRKKAAVPGPGGDGGHC